MFILGVLAEGEHDPSQVGPTSLSKRIPYSSYFSMLLVKSASLYEASSDITFKLILLLY